MSGISFTPGSFAYCDPAGNVNGGLNLLLPKLSGTTPAWAKSYWYKNGPVNPSGCIMAMRTATPNYFMLLKVWHSSGGHIFVEIGDGLGNEAAVCTVNPVLENDGVYHNVMVSGSSIIGLNSSSFANQIVVTHELDPCPLQFIQGSTTSQNGLPWQGAFTSIGFDPHAQGADTLQYTGAVDFMWWSPFRQPVNPNDASNGGTPIAYVSAIQIFNSYLARKGGNTMYAGNPGYDGNVPFPDILPGLPVFPNKGYGGLNWLPSNGIPPIWLHGGSVSAFLANHSKLFSLLGWDAHGLLGSTKFTQVGTINPTVDDPMIG